MIKPRGTVLSLFTGGMGLDLGFHRAGGWRLLGCVELQPTFCESIRQNIAADRIGSVDTKVECRDASELNSNQLIASWGCDPPDVVIGGPPCQAFSVYGKRRGVADDRGRLIYDFQRCVVELQPAVFVMENVRGLMSLPLPGHQSKGGLFADFVERFEAAGYRVDSFVVNCVNYGAPQIRERVLLIGNRLGLQAEFPSPTHSNRPADGLEPFATLGFAIRDRPDPDPMVMQFSPRKQRYLAQVPPGGNWRSLPVEVQKESMGKTFYLKGGRSAYWRKLSFDFPCPTVVTMPNHAGTSMCHPEHLRPLTVGECALVQEFPTDWTFCGTVAERYQQVGNAVPVRLGELAARVVADLLDHARHGGYSRSPAQPVASRVVHLRPHVRTRWWWKDGEVVAGLAYTARPAKAVASNPAHPSLFD